MTVVSLVLIVVAVVLLGYGLLDGSNTYLVGSILTSLLAALALVIGSRRSGRAAVAAAVEAEEARGRRRARQEEMVGAGVGGRGDRTAPASDEYTDHDDLARGTHDTALLDLDGGRGVPTQSPSAESADSRPDREDSRSFVEDYADRGPDAYGAHQDDDDYDYDYDDEDPEGEPPAQRVSPADAARVAQLNAGVLVIDGRPRYHLPGCVHLLGREHEELPVSEAVELGFSPCGLCEPDSALLANARRV